MIYPSATAVRPRFDDGHATGIYSWDYLYWLGAEQPRLWQDYLDRLAAAGASRAPAGAPASDPAVATDDGVRSVSRPR